MAFAAFLTTGCGALPRACLRYLLGGLIMGVTMTLFAPFQALSPEMRSFVTTEFRGDLTASPIFSAETVTLLRREHVRALRSVSDS